MAVEDGCRRGVGREESALTGGRPIDFQDGSSDGPNDHAFGAQIFQNGRHSIGGCPGGEDVVHEDP